MDEKQPIKKEIKEEEDEKSDNGEEDLEEGELSDEDDGIIDAAASVSRQQRALSSSQNQPHHEKSIPPIINLLKSDQPVISKNFPATNSVSSRSSKEKAAHESASTHNREPLLSSPTSGKKKGRESQNNQQALNSSAETKISDNANDVESFFKRKKQELAEKVKNQLRLAGVEAKVESGSESDPECVKPDASEKYGRGGAALGRKRSGTVGEVTKTSTPAKYYDLDKLDDPTETMISNWVKGKAETKARLSPHSAYDPYDEYYQASAPAVNEEAEVVKSDQDYRPMAGVPSDQDYRFNSGYDVDYRRKHAENEGAIGPDEYGSFSERSDGGNYSEDQENAANEFGDIDERRRADAAARRSRGSSAAASSRRPPVPANRGRRGRHYNSESESEEDNDDRRSRRLGRQDNSRISDKRSRSPVKRRLGLLRTDRAAGGGQEYPICKFYREGYCREGESCLFSHDLEPSSSTRSQGRKPELCKFYKNGYCRNGRGCPFLHGDFPCKDFHKGECKEGEKCRFSHDSLNDLTRPLFDKMLKDEELYPKISIPDAPSRRKVLLGEPPKIGPAPPLNGPHPAISTSRNVSHDTSNSSLQQTSSGSTSSYQQDMNAYSSYDDNNRMQQQQEQMHTPSYQNSNASSNVSSSFQAADITTSRSVLSPPKTSSSATEDDRKSADTSNAAVIDIAAMLRQIKAEVKGQEIIQESPASPEPTPMDQSSSFAPILRTTIKPEYRLIPFDLPPPAFSDPNYQQTLMRLSLNDAKLSNDPRIKKILSSQFDAVSDMISSQKAAKDQQIGDGSLDSPVSGVSSRSGSQQQKNHLSDSRLQASSSFVRDPRLKSSGASPPQALQRQTYGSMQAPENYPLGTATAGTMAYGSYPSASPNAAVGTMNNPLAGNPMNLPPMLSQQQQQQGLANAQALAQSQTGAAASGGWMPQMGALGGAGWLPQAPPTNHHPAAHHHPQVHPLIHHRYGPAVNALHPSPSSIGPSTSDFDRDPRSRRGGPILPKPLGGGADSSFYAPSPSPLLPTPDSSEIIQSATAATTTPSSDVGSYLDHTHHTHNPYPLQKPVAAIAVVSAITQSPYGGGSDHVTSPSSNSNNNNNNNHNNQSASSMAPIQPLSLREKRKNLEYESPLSSSSKANSDVNRYYSYSSLGVKIKKKESSVEG